MEGKNQPQLAPPLVIAEPEPPRSCSARADIRSEIPQSLIFLEPLAGLEPVTC
jgi:hypothetical protein